MKKWNHPTKSTIRLAVLVVFGFLFGYWLNADGSRDMEAQTTPVATATDTRSARQPVYVCPMMCIPPRHAPGNCPICGMDLVAEYGPGESEGPPMIRMEEEARRLAGVRTTAVVRKFVTAEVRLYGEIDYDPAHVTEISAFMPGVIDRVYVKRAGQFVRWGEPLFDIYSSDLLETQKQLIEAMKYTPSFFAFQAGTPHSAREVPVQDRLATPDAANSPEAEAAMKKLAAIRHKLSILGLPKRDIDEMMKKGEATGIATVYSSVYGQVIDQRAFEGAYVNTGTPIFTMGDPRYVWVRLEAYETDYPWLRKNQEVVFETDAYPGETFTAKIVYIDPVFNNKTRTFTMGAIASESGGRLLAGMLVHATIHAKLTENGQVANPGDSLEKAPLVIPATAPLITGKRALVYVEDPVQEGSFEGREIILGPRAGNHYVVRGGLKEGENVVERGNFKIDSALQILARPSMMTSPGGNAAVSYNNPGGSETLRRNYWNQRMASRLEVVREEENDRDEEVDSRDSRLEPEGRPYGRRIIHRRKPGNYGDNTRQMPRRIQ